jgi:hypothetical protein
MFKKDTFDKIAKVFAYAFVAYETLMFVKDKLELVEKNNYQLGAVKDEN